MAHTFTVRSFVANVVYLDLFKYKPLTGVAMSYETAGAFKPVKHCLHSVFCEFCLLAFIKLKRKERCTVVLMIMLLLHELSGGKIRNPWLFVTGC